MTREKWPDMTGRDPTGKGQRRVIEKRKLKILRILHRGSYGATKRQYFRKSGKLYPHYKIRKRGHWRRRFPEL